MVDVEKLSKLGELHAAGVLSDEEFAEAKAQLLRKNGAQGTSAVTSAPEEPVAASLPPYEGPPVIVPFFTVEREQVAALLSFRQAVQPEPETVDAIQSATIPMTFEWDDGILRFEAALRDLYGTELARTWPSLTVLGDGIRSEMRIAEAGRSLTLLDRILDTTGSSWSEFRWLSGVVNNDPAEWEVHKTAVLPPSAGKHLTPEKLASGVEMVVNDRKKRRISFAAVGESGAGLSVFPEFGGAVRVAVISDEAAPLAQMLGSAWPVSGDPVARQPRCFVVDFEHAKDSLHGIMTYLTEVQSAAPELFSELRVPKGPAAFREHVNLDELYPPMTEGTWLSVQEVKDQRIFVNLEAVVVGRCPKCRYEREVIGSQIMGAVQESSAGRKLSRAGNALSHFGNAMTPGIGTMLAGRSAGRVATDREARGAVDAVTICPNCGRGEVAYNVLT